MNRQQTAAKNFLMKAYRVDQRINTRIEQIASLNDMALKATSTISDMPGCATRDVHKKEDVIVRILDLEERLKQDMVQLIELKRQILDAIAKMDDPELQTLLEMRYVSYSSWEQIAVELNYGIDNVFKPHRKALDLIRIPESVQ